MSNLTFKSPIRSYETAHGFSRARRRGLCYATEVTPVFDGPRSMIEPLRYYVRHHGSVIAQFGRTPAALQATLDRDHPLYGELYDTVLTSAGYHSATTTRRLHMMVPDKARVSIGLSGGLATVRDSHGYELSFDRVLIDSATGRTIAETLDGRTMLVHPGEDA